MTWKTLYKQAEFGTYIETSIPYEPKSREEIKAEVDALYEQSDVEGLDRKSYTIGVMESLIQKSEVQKSHLVDTIIRLREENNRLRTEAMEI